MKRVLIDTNVVVDFFLKRGEFFANADKIFAAVRERKIQGCVSSSVVTDLHFIIGRKAGERRAREAVESIYATFAILPVSRGTIGQALNNGMADFEDAVQAETAKTVGVDVVVTRDKAGFADSGLNVFEPEEFVNHLTV